MEGFMAQIEFWHWWILGLSLGVIEVLMPGFFLLWIGLAAGITGLLALIVPGTPWQLQFIFFGVLSVASVFGWRTYLRRHPVQSDDATLNRRGAQYVGRVFNIEDAIVNGRGTVRVGDSIWRAEGPDLPAGRRVKVVDVVSGTVLKVEAVEA